MTTHQLQQTMTNARRAIGTHGWGMGLSILLLVAALAAYRYTVPQHAEPAVAAVAVVLGIDAPQGVDLHDLPRGLTDYIRPGSITSVVHTQSSQLGIDLPYGADLRTLPRGLSDYIRPQHAEPSVAAASAVLGITMPTGAQYTDLPRGVTDYLRANK